MNCWEPQKMLIMSLKKTSEFEKHLRAAPSGTGLRMNEETLRIPIF
jgi:hypothetical protein